MKAFGEQWTSLEVKDSRFHTDGDVVFSHSHVYATGQAVAWPLLQFFKMRDGKILELHPFHWDTAAMLPALRDS